MSIQQLKTAAPNAVIPGVFPRLLSPKQSMQYTGLGRDVVYAMIHNRVIPYIILSGQGGNDKYLIDRMDWDRWIERRKIPVVA